MDILSATGAALPEKVRAFFTTRNGGVSDAPYHSLNLSINVGDDLEAVYENRIRITEQLPGEPMWLRQAHGSRVLEAQNINRDVDVADAAFTAAPEVVCVVQSADCLPVLLYNEAGTRVAAAHAGWRGLAAGVLENAVAAMQQADSSPLQAFIGPAISAAHFMVEAQVLEALGITADDECVFAGTNGNAGKWHVDLLALAARRLHRAGVNRVHSTSLCTYDKKQLLFSARRDQGGTGRQAGIIYIAA